MKKARLLTSILAGAMALTAGHAIAQNITPDSQAAKNLQTLERSLPSVKIGKPSVEITTQTSATSPIPLPDSVSAYAIYNDSDHTIYNSDRLLIDPSRTSTVSQSLSNVQNGITRSQYEFTSEANENLSEKEKLAVLAATSASMYLKAYDKLKYNAKTSTSEGFDSLQKSSRGERNSFGVCDQISNYIAKTGTDMGLDIKSVSSNEEYSSHAYDIAKLSDGGIAIVNSNNVFLSGKNVKDALASYQKFLKTVAFENLFMNEKDVPEYKIITRDGKNFLNFIGYDPSTEKMKSLVLDPPKTKEKDLEATIISNGSEHSKELNFKGFFAKEGTIIGDVSSPLVYEKLSEAGFKRSFYFPKQKLVFSPDINLTIGKMEEDYDSKNKIIASGSLGFSLASAKEKGLNFGLGLKGNFTGKTTEDFNTLDSINTGKRGSVESSIYKRLYSLFSDNLFYDTSIEGGLSYTIPAEDNVSIKPYILSQISLVEPKFNNWEFHPRINSLEAGASFNAKLSDNVKLSANPYFSMTEGQKGEGVKIKLETPYVDIRASDSLFQHTYDFAPNTTSFSLGADVKLGNTKISGDYSYKADDYSGSISPQSKLDIKFSRTY